MKLISHVQNDVSHKTYANKSSLEDNTHFTNCSKYFLNRFENHFRMNALSYVIILDNSSPALIHPFFCVWRSISKHKNPLIDILLRVHQSILKGRKRRRWRWRRSEGKSEGRMHRFSFHLSNCWLSLSSDNLYISQKYMKSYQSKDIQHDHTFYLSKTRLFSSFFYSTTQSSFLAIF